ncbi:hypothetical protein BH11BAC5_BH11BAC5_29590 [soil metagenome]|jgi:hypothetical protein|nr:hypothetical protein [Ferruginibacter sp.]
MDKFLAIGLLVISLVLLVAHFSDIKQTHKNG